jgi:hypothetical protein
MQYRSFLIAMLFCSCLADTVSAEEMRRLPIEEYVDSMKAGWIG